MKFFKSSKCYKGGNQHNFVARFDERYKQVELTPLLHVNYAARGKCIPTESIESMFYVKDVCIWCGKEIKRNEVDKGV